MTDTKTVLPDGARAGDGKDAASALEAWPAVSYMFNEEHFGGKVKAVVSLSPPEDDRPRIELIPKETAVALLAAAPAVSAGWKLVPVEPTREMISATEVCPGIRTINNVLMLHAARTGLREFPGCGDTPEESAVAQAYRAMLAAAPGFQT